MKFLPIWGFLGLVVALTALGCAASAPSRPTSTSAPGVQPLTTAQPAPDSPAVAITSPSPTAAPGGASPITPAAGSAPPSAATPPTMATAPSPASPATETSPTTSPTATAAAVPEAPPVPVGSAVGQRVPDFTLNLADGSTVTSQHLLDDAQPTFLFFFATW